MLLEFTLVRVATKLHSTVLISKYIKMYFYLPVAECEGLLEETCSQYDLQIESNQDSRSQYHQENCL